MEIKRDYYLNKLIESENNGLIKVVTGIRRVGKSYLLFTIFYKYLMNKGIDKEHIIDVALDDRINKELRNPDNMLEYIRSKIIDDEQYYIMLDEVQLMEDFEDVLLSLLHIKNVDVYVTGSNSKFLSSDVLTQFRGRGDDIHVYPLTFKEFMSAYDGNVDDAWQEYFLYGGMPYLFNCNSKQKKIEYLKSLFEKVYIADILERNKRIRNKEELDELLDILSSAIGSYTNALKLSATFKSVKNKKISDKTIARYIGYFIDAFLISQAKRYNVKGKKYIGSPYKYYFQDIGLRNSRLNFRQTEENHIMENIIYNELLARGFGVDVGTVDVFDDGKSKQLEIDFIANYGDQKYYIQSALNLDTEEKNIQEKKSLLNTNDSFKKIIIVSGNKKPQRDDNGFVIMGILHFLLNENSLDE